jgi:hypothetical protein
VLPSLELGIDPVTTGVELGKDTPLCNLWVAMLDRIGAPVKNFADSNGALGIG